MSLGGVVGMVKVAKRLVVGNARGDDGWRRGEGEKAFPCHAKIGQVARLVAHSPVFYAVGTYRWSL